MSQKKIILIIFVLLALTGIFFRLWNLDKWPGVNGDEAWYGVWAQDYLAGKEPATVTPTNNPLNQFYLYPMVLVEKFSEGPAFVNLRIPALLNGLLLLVLAYPMMKSIVGRENALLFALLLCCLPHLMAYSRLGWDASQTPLALLICVFFSLQLKPILDKKNILLALGLVLSVWVAIRVHPTNMLALGLLVMPFVTELLKKYQRLRSPVYYSLGLGCIVFLITAIGFPEIFIQNLNAISISKYLRGENIVNHLKNFGDFYDVFLAFGRLLSGLTILSYQVKSFSPSVELIFDVLTWLVLLPLLFFGLKHLYQKREYGQMTFVLSIMPTLLGVYLLVGKKAFMPGVERYTVFLIVPGVMAMVLLMKDLKHKKIMTALMSGAFLLSFYLLYLVPMSETGGQTHRCYHTGEVEPKEAAYKAIVDAQGSGTKVAVMAEDWWSFKPLEYLGYQNKDFSIIQIKAQQDYVGFLKNEKPTVQKDVYAIGFYKKQFSQLLKAPIWDVWKTFSNANGEPILYVWKRKR